MAVAEAAKCPVLVVRRARGVDADDDRMSVLTEPCCLVD
jgi:hypothetical protein